MSVFSHGRLGESWRYCIIPGNPVPAGSRRAIPIKTKEGRVRVAMVPASDKQKAWQDVVRLAVASLWDQPPLHGPVAIYMVFVFPRPKGHYRGGNPEKGLKPDAPFWHTARPDVDKLQRCLLDALTGVVFADDSQVVWTPSQKIYGVCGRVILLIHPLGGQWINPIDGQAGQEIIQWLNEQVLPECASGKETK